MNEWTSIIDGLPKTDGHYLVYKDTGLGFGMQEVCGFARNLKDIDDYWFTKKRAGFYKYDRECGFYEPDDITHWMPLPEPPKEETE